MVAVRVLALLPLAACLSTPPPPNCSPPRELSEVNSGSVDLSPFLAKNRLELMLASERDGYFTLYRATRASIDTLFDAPQVFIDPVASPQAFDASISDDGADLWYVSGDGNSGGQVMHALRDGSKRGYGDAFLDPSFTRLGQILHPSLTADKLDVFYAVVNGGIGTAIYHDIRHSHRSGADGEFGPGEVVAISTDAWDEFNPSISADGMTLYFSTNGVEGMAGEHVMVSSGPSFSEAKLVDAIGPAADQNDDFGAVHADGRTLVFSTDRETTGGQHIWIACE